MGMLKFLLLVSLAYGSTSFATTVQALDPDFFSSSPQLDPGNRTRALDPDYFVREKTLPYNEPGTFGCTTVASYTPTGEAAKVGSVGRNFCSSNPQVRWIPNVRVWRDSQDDRPLFQSYPQITGYYQICCIRKANARSRRPGPR